MTDTALPAKPMLSQGQMRGLAGAGGFVLLVIVLTLATRSGAIGPNDWTYKILVDPFVTMWSIPDLFIQTLWEGFVAGVLYALIALGFVLIFKASGVFNFAQGIMVVFAALSLIGIYDILVGRFGLPPGHAAAAVAMISTLTGKASRPSSRKRPMAAVGGRAARSGATAAVRRATASRWTPMSRAMPLTRPRRLSRSDRAAGTARAQYTASW